MDTEKTTLKEVLLELQKSILEKHSPDVGYKLHVQDGDSALSMEVYVPRNNSHQQTTPRKDLSTEMVEQALLDAGFADQPLKIEVGAAGKILVKKTRKVEPWDEVNEVLRGLGLRWVTYDDKDKANTGLWRQP